MDALKFMKERRRMCDYYSRCLECPRGDKLNCNIEEMSDEELENFVNNVEQWSKEHTLRTRLQDFREKYNNAPRGTEGLPRVCCETLGYCNHCNANRADCENCWNMPVEEDK